MNELTSRGVRLGAILGGLWWVAELISGNVAAQPPPEPQPYDSKGKRDPFVALVREGRFVGTAGTFSSGSSVSGLQLAGILWDPGGNSLALINDTEVKVGDVVGEYHVMEIRQDAVVIVREGKPVVLHMSFDGQDPSHE